MPMRHPSPPTSRPCSIYSQNARGVGDSMQPRKASSQERMTPPPPRRTTMSLNDRQLLRLALRHDLLAFTIRAFQTVKPGTEYRDNWHIQAIVYQLMRCR